MKYIRIDSDNWADASRTWLVLEYYRRDQSTAVELTLKDSFGRVEKRVVPLNQIEWLEDNVSF